MSIGDRVQEISGRIKGYIDKGAEEWASPILVILVGLSSFGLGRLSAHEASRPPVSIRQAPISEIKPVAIGGQVVASRSGTTYHFPWCPGAISMKESNKIWFKDEAAATKAGYTPAKNCEGLH